MRSTLVDDEAVQEDARESGADLERTAALRRGLVLAAAFVSFLFSVSLYFTGSEQEGIFVGIWVPSILALGAFLFPRRA
jgi:hypothetical protein